MSARKPPLDRGAALLTILMIVSVMSVAAIAAVSALSRSVELTRAASHRGQTRLAALSVLEIGAPIVEQFLALSENGELPDDTIPLPFEHGLINLTATDATNCFNLNQLGAIDDSLSEERYQALLVSLGFFESDARALTDSLADWIDSDNTPRAFGQESSFYARQDTPYHAANTNLANITELHAVEGYTPEIVERLLPFVCTRPTKNQVPLNIESLKPEDASLLVALFSNELRVETAESLILGRPIAGWRSEEDFLTHPTILQIAEEARNQSMISIHPAHIDLHATITSGPMTEKLTLTYATIAGSSPQLLQRTAGGSQ